MGDLVRLSASLYLIAVLARVGRAVSTETAIGIACVATAVLMWAHVRYMRNKPGMELWQLIPVEIAGTWILISLMLLID